MLKKDGQCCFQAQQIPEGHNCLYCKEPLHPQCAKAYIDVTQLRSIGNVVLPHWASGPICSECHEKKGSQDVMVPPVIDEAELAEPPESPWVGPSSRDAHDKQVTGLPQVVQAALRNYGHNNSGPELLSPKNYKMHLRLSNQTMEKE